MGKGTFMNREAQRYLSDEIFNCRSERLGDRKYLDGSRVRTPAISSSEESQEGCSPVGILEIRCSISE